ncbi:hypothetical protein [Priestia megaterium]|uniref:hypothetical protein n=1 Tax=Priestia megaterium TaxID=1404 RepID=UPI003101B118
MLKENPQGNNNSESLERANYSNYNNLDSNNDSTLNRIVAEDGRIGNIMLDLAGGYVTNEDPTSVDEDSSTS